MKKIKINKSKKYTIKLKKIKIKSKKSIGVHPVYDIEVEGSHHYILENGVVSHNSGFMYASSVVVAMKKLKLKEDAAGNKISDVRGIRAACKVMKSRFSKPFESIQIKIPYETGMDEFGGLIDLFEKSGDLVKQGHRLSYTDKDGNEHIHFRKDWNADTLQVILQDKNRT